MADQPNTPSGSRWEPEPGDGPTEQTPAAPEVQEAGTTPDAPPPYDVTADDPADDAVLDDGAAADERRTRLRHRAALAGAATALAVSGGVTGFVIGHSTAGDRHDGFVPANFSRQAPGNGQLGEGQQVPPGWNGDGRHDGDGDGGPFGQQAPGTNGSNGSSSSDGSGSSANPT